MLVTHDPILQALGDFVDHDFLHFGHVLVGHPDEEGFGPVDYLPRSVQVAERALPQLALPQLPQTGHEGCGQEGEVVRLEVLRAF